MTSPAPRRRRRRPGPRPTPPTPTDHRDNRDNRDNRDSGSGAPTGGQRTGRPAPKRQPAPADRDASTTRTATAPATGPVVALADGAVPSFAELGIPDALIGVLAAQHINAPFPIQAATIGDTLTGRDILGQGRTGSGKTLAFTLPLVTRLAAGDKARPRRPRALILAPTRELALQIADTVAPLAAAVGRTVTTIFGGVADAPQQRTLSAGVDIVVACPGRLLDHLGRSNLTLADVSICVLDEADHMADQGFLPMVRRILDQVPDGAQKLLYSATLAGGVDTIVNRYLHRPVTHRTADEPPAELDHRVVVVDEDARIDTVVELAAGGRTVVFTRTKHRAKQLTRKLAARGVAAVELHGNLSQNARQRNLAAFADGTAPILVATDIAARGIHVDDVATVVHADPPIEHKAYTHRSGRTARAGAAGTVHTIATADQTAEVRRLLVKAGVTATWEHRHTTTTATTPSKTGPSKTGPSKTGPSKTGPSKSAPAAGATPRRPAGPAGTRRPSRPPRHH